MYSYRRFWQFQGRGHFKMGNIIVHEAFWAAAVLKNHIMKDLCCQIKAQCNDLNSEKSEFDFYKKTNKTQNDFWKEHVV